MGVHVVGNRGFFKPGLGLTRIFLMTLLGLLYDGPASLWANPTIGDESESHQIWNFDSEMAGTLPQNFVVGTLVDGRPAGEWKVTNMKNSGLASWFGSN